MKVSKIEIRQVDGERGIFTEILVDGHKLEGVLTKDAEIQHTKSNTHGKS